ncbi:HI0074 family nucleotidyltransferase substrate-binding subunit [Thermophilibacter sp.]
MRKYENFSSALDVLMRAPEQDLSNEFVQSGVIDKFTLQFELGWKLLKELLAYEGDAVAATGSPRDIIKAAHRYYDFMNEATWLSMLRDRNNTAHVYDESAARRLVATVIDRYIPEFGRLRAGLLARYGELLTAPDASCDH